MKIIAARYRMLFTNTFLEWAAAVDSAEQEANRVSRFTIISRRECYSPEWRVIRPRIWQMLTEVSALVVEQIHSLVVMEAAFL